MESDTPSKLAWQAFRYLSADVSPAEVAEFELEMAETQPAREAVADMVETLEAIRIAEGLQPSLARRRRFSRSLWWVGAGLAACAGAVALIPLFGTAVSVPRRNAEERSADQIAIAITWTDVRTESQGAEEPWVAEVDDWLEEAQPVDTASEAVEVDSELPTWLLAAAALEVQSSEIERID